MDQIKTPLPHITSLDIFKSNKGDVKHGIKSSDKSFLGLERHIFFCKAEYDKGLEAS